MERSLTKTGTVPLCSLPPAFALCTPRVATPFLWAQACYTVDIWESPSAFPSLC